MRRRSNSVKVSVVPVQEAAQFLGKVWLREIWPKIDVGLLSGIERARPPHSQVTIDIVIPRYDEEPILLQVGCSQQIVEKLSSKLIFRFFPRMRNISCGEDYVGSESSLAIFGD